MSRAAALGRRAFTLDVRAGFCYSGLRSPKKCSSSPWKLQNQNAAGYAVRLHTPAAICRFVSRQIESVLEEVAFELPIGHGGTVLRPFPLFPIDVSPAHMLSQGIHQQPIGLKLINGLLQRGGKAAYAHLKALGGGHIIDALLHRVRGRQVPAYAVQPGSQATGQGQIGIAGRVGAAKLDAGGVAPGCGNPDQRRTVGG